MDDDNKTWMERMKAQMPKFGITYFDYSFNTSGSLYKPGRESENPVKPFWGSAPASENIVYTDFQSKKVSALKKIYEESFLVQDSVKKLQWKIHDEIRTIAGFKCRKAVARMLDSVYVVAFYTEDIIASGGPEMFAGLPGMILEIAVPRLYTTWIATKVEVVQPMPADLKAPDKGRKVTQKELYETINASVGKWGKYAHRSIWWSVL
jgi:GLPGLI family protein